MDEPFVKGMSLRSQATYTTDHSLENATAAYAYADADADADVDEPVLLMLDKWMQEAPHLSVGFTTKLGGASKGVWKSLNTALHVGDDEHDVIANREEIAQKLGFPFAAWTCAEQIHGQRVHVVTRRDAGSGRLTRDDAIPNTDALITNEPNIWLTSFYADCVPLYFYDPFLKVVGLAHAGWKGTVASIAQSTIKAMVDTYGCNVSALKAAIGPAIGACCYEVDTHVVEHVKAAQMMEGVTPKANGRYWLDLKLLNRQIMIKAGILPSQIEMSHRCTACEADLFFSHRRDRGQTGRMMSWIGMKMG